jgi:hypothetical protein
VGEPYEDPRFYNAVEYTVAVTFTVRGGKRHGTADRQARKIAERLASNAARMVGVVDVRATAGPSSDGQTTSPRLIRFAVANTGQARHGEPGKLDRYLDPDHELALRSLAAANAAAEERRRADHKRRLTAGCRHASQLAVFSRFCECVYCQPDLHYDAVIAVRSSGHSPFIEHRCVCGHSVNGLGERCTLHHQTTIAVLEDDPPTLQLLADAERETQL